VSVAAVVSPRFTATAVPATRGCLRDDGVDERTGADVDATRRVMSGALSFAACAGRAGALLALWRTVADVSRATAAPVGGATFETAGCAVGA
jgi:hypothetical protein